MLKYVSVYIFLLFLPLNSYSQDNAAMNFLELAASKLDKIKIGEYKIVTRQKFMFHSTSDTLSFPGACYFEKHASLDLDTTLFSVHTNDSTSKSEFLYYPKEKFYSQINNRDSSMTFWQTIQSHRLSLDRAVFKTLISYNYLRSQLSITDSLWLELDTIERTFILCFFNKESNPDNKVKVNSDLIKIYFNADTLPFRETIYSDIVDYDTDQYIDATIENLKLDIVAKPRMDLEYLKSGYKYVDGVEKEKGIRANREKNIIKKGMLAQNWKLETYEGDSIELYASTGKLILLDFWYKSCYPCILSMPLIDKLSKKYKDKGLVVIGVNPIDKDNQKVLGFKEKKGFEIKSVYGPNIPGLYGLTGYPSYVFLDENFKVLRVQTGYGMEETETDFDNWIEEYLKE